MSLRLEHAIVPLVVVLDYVALSWFPQLATVTGHPEAAFRVGTVVFIGANAGVLLLGARALPPRAGALLTRVFAKVPAAPPIRWMVFAALVAAAISYRLSAIGRTSLDPQMADMLPLISAASHRLLAGVNPYQPAGIVQSGQLLPGVWVPYVPAWLPGLWLPYVPAVWAGVDLRLVGLLAALLTAMLLGVARWSRAGEPDPAGDVAIAWLRLVPALGLLLAPAAVWFGAIGHTQTYWLYLVALVWALARRWWGLAGLCLGLSIMTRHTVLPLLPVVGLYAWRCLAPRARVRLAVVAALVVVALALPFGVQGLWQFTIGSPRWYMKFGDQGWNGPRWWVTHTFGISAFLYPLGLSRAIPWVGAALVLSVYAFAWRRLRDLASAVRCLALTLLVVTVSVPTPFRYEFFPIILVLSALPLLPTGRSGRTAAVMT